MYDVRDDGFEIGECEETEMTSQTSVEISIANARIVLYSAMLPSCERHH
jgi:hypothetical protein